MIAALTRLLTLIALMLMPLGMTGAPAVASPMPASRMMASADHCDDESHPNPAPGSKMDCAALCTALPATDAPEPAPILQPTAPRLIGGATPFTGIDLEVATPPPKNI